MKNKKEYTPKTDIERILKAFREIYYDNLSLEDRKRIVEYCKVHNPQVFKLLSIRKLYNN